MAIPDFGPLMFGSGRGTRPGTGDDAKDLLRDRIQAIGRDNISAEWRTGIRAESRRRPVVFGS